MSDNQTTHKKLYYPELDGLRFIAFLLVYFSHAPILAPSIAFIKLHDYGWVGVDLFLCLSAFLFTKLLHMEYEQTGDIKIIYFYIRRGFRTWPVYYFFILFLMGVTSIMQLPLQWGRFLGLLTFTDNIVSAFAGYNPILYSAHLWTIAYEEQFYVIIPVALKKLFSYTPFKKMIILVVVFLSGMVCRSILIYFSAPHPAIWVLPISHFDSSLTGLMVGLGMFDSFLKKFPTWIIGVIGTACFCLVCFLPNVDQITWLLMISYPLIGMGTGFILWFVINSKLKINKILSFRPISFLGKISYGLYLYHYMGLGLFNKKNLELLFSTDAISLRFLLPLLLTIIFAISSYIIIEKPFLRMKGKYTIIESRPI